MTGAMIVFLVLSCLLSLLSLCGAEETQAFRSGPGDITVQAGDTVSISHIALIMSSSS